MSPHHRTPTRLTRRQEEVLGAVHGYIEQNGWAPSIRELCEMVGSKHPKSVASILDILERKEFVRRGNAPRALALTSKGRIHLKADGVYFLEGKIDSPEALADYAIELYFDRKRLEQELAAKNEAVHVQTTARRILSKRAERLATQVKVLTFRLQGIGEAGGQPS